MRERRADSGHCLPSNSITQSVTFTRPSPAATQEHGFTWDISAYGGTTPIHSSFPPFLWGDHPILRGAWTDMGVQPRKECAGGNKEGLCWIPISQHPVTARRSHAGLGHYAAVNETRPNYHLLDRHQVTRVTYPKGLKKGPPRVEVRSLADNSMFNITAKAEVVLSAGTFHTPTILQRSGIGPASFLQAAGIPVVLNLPGVGSNLQDHSGPAISWNCKCCPPLYSWLRRWTHPVHILLTRTRLTRYESPAKHIFPLGVGDAGPLVCVRRVGGL